MFGKITVVVTGKLSAMSHHIFPSLFTALIGGYVIQIYCLNIQGLSKKQD